MPAEKGIFLDVLPRFDMAALGLILSKIQGMFSKTGAAIGSSFGAEAETKLRSLSEAAVRANNLVTDSDIRAERAAHAHEVARMRLNEMVAAGVSKQSTLAKATYAVADADLLATARARDAAAARRVAAEAEGAHATALAASTVAVGNLGKALNVAGMVATGGFIYAVAESSHKAADFQEKLVRLVASAGEVTSNLETVSKGLMNVASQTGYTASELADGMYLVEKAAYRGADGITVMRAAAQLARAENTSLEEVIQGLTTSMRDFHIPVEKAAEVASKMNIAVGDSKTTLQLFSGALHNIEPIAMIAGMRLEEVYAAMARITQSGTTPDQGSQQMSNMVQHFTNITGTQRDAMGKMGLNADELKKKLGDPEVGLVGVLHILSETINSRLTPDQLVMVDTTYKNAQAVSTLSKMYSVMSDSAKSLVDGVKSGAMSWEEFHKASRKGNDEDRAKLMQWDQMNTKIMGYSSNLKKMQSEEQTVAQTWKELTGTDAGFKIAAQLAGTPEALHEYNEELNKILAATTEADGTVHGFNKTQETLNAQLRDAKASFGNVAIQLGNAFIPALTVAAEALGWVAEKLYEHPAIMFTVVGLMGAMSTAWLAWKAIVIGQALWGAITGGFAAMFGWLGRINASLGLLISETLGIVPAQATATSAVVAGSAAEVVAVAGIGTAALAAIPLVGLLASAIWMTKQAERAPAMGGDAGVAAATTVKGMSEEDIAKLTVPEGAAKPGSADAEMAMTGMATQDGEFHDAAKWVVSTGDKWDQAARYAWLMNHEEDAKNGRFKPPTDYLPEGFKPPGADIPDPQKELDEKLKAITDGIPGSLDDIIHPPDSALGLDSTPFVDPFGSEAEKEAKKREKELAELRSKAPDGSKDDPIFTLPMPDFGAGGVGLAPDKDKKGDGVGENYDPFQEAGSGGWTLPNVAKLMATWAANMAFGNPYGKLQAAKKGETKGNPMYVQDVGPGGLLGQAGITPNADGTITATQSQLDLLQKNYDILLLQAKRDKALAENGAGSPEAQKAEMDLLAGRQSRDEMVAKKAQKDKENAEKETERLARIAELEAGLPAGSLTTPGSAPGSSSSSSTAGDASSSASTPAASLGPRGSNPSNPVYVAVVSGSLGAGGAAGGAAFSASGEYAGDAALLANIPKGGHYLRDGEDADLTKGLADCTSGIEDLVNIMDGRPTGGRSMNTNSDYGGNAASWLLNRGFLGTQEPVPGAFNVGYNHHHMEGTLPDGTNVNFGSDAAVASGGTSGAAGAWGDPSFTSHYYRPVGTKPAPVQWPAVTPSGTGGTTNGGAAPSSPGLRVSPGITATPGSAGGVAGTGLPALAPNNYGSAANANPALTPPIVPGAAAAGGPGPTGNGPGGAPTGGGLGTAGRGPGGMGPAPGASPFAQHQAPPPNSSQQLTSSGSGFGVSGGLLGTAQAAASQAISAGVNMVAPGAGAAAGAVADIASQEANRAVGYLGQLAGIGVSGLLETFSLNDSPIADPSKSLFGKVALGIAGAHASNNNSAGQTAPPLKPEEGKDPNAPDGQQPQGAAPLVHIENMTNNQGDGQQVGKDIGRQLMAVSPNGG
jgi:hypothetical protein